MRNEDPEIPRPTETKATDETLSPEHLNAAVSYLLCCIVVLHDVVLAVVDVVDRCCFVYFTVCDLGPSQTKGFRPLLDVYFPSIYRIFRATHNANR